MLFSGARWWQSLGGQQRTIVIHDDGMDITVMEVLRWRFHSRDKNLLLLRRHGLWPRGSERRQVGSWGSGGGATIGAYEQLTLVKHPSCKIGIIGSFVYVESLVEEAPKATTRPWVEGKRKRDDAPTGRNSRSQSQGGKGR
ncbi:hypothetical protein SESBI_10748 [Sesbania bispinosa]|nr:hypothetical protein SESBI_10748 [Sesbania bispinosa]